VKTRLWRLAFGALGLAVLARGVYLLNTTVKSSQWAEIGLWLLAGLVLHDAVIAPLTLLLGRVLRPATALRAGWLAAGSVVLLSIPLFEGAKVRRNPTVIPGSPLAHVAIALTLVAAGTVIAALVRLRSRRSARAARSGRSPQPG
jgi:hypothetical protein